MGMSARSGVRAIDGEEDRPLVLTGLRTKSGRVCDMTMRCVSPDLPEFADIGCRVAVLEDVTDRNRARDLIENFNKQLELKVIEKTRELSLASEELKAEIREHQRDQDALRFSEFRFHSFVEKTMIGIYLAENGRIAYHNSRFGELFGYGTDGLLGTRLKDVFGRQCHQNSATGTALNSPDDGLECRCRRRDGSAIWIHVTQTPYVEGTNDLVVGNVLDVTARKDFESRLIEANRRASMLSENILLTQEHERRRIARELHDGIGQRLNAIKLALENVGDDCAGSGCVLRIERIAEIAASLRDTVEETRRVAMALRPSMLDDLGVSATLNWFLREMGKTIPEMRIEHRIQVDENAFGPRVKTEIFRITQEAFNNIVKHSRASAASLSLTMCEADLLLVIRDNGRGATCDAGTGHCGMGLHSMRERAELSGGDLFVISRDSKGVSVICRWPRTTVGTARWVRPHVESRRR
jgi:PAS domain S-box-containing protein